MELRRIRPEEHAAAGDVCVAAYEPFLTGASMLIAGDRKEKVVLYPISCEAADRGDSLANWAV